MICKGITEPSNFKLGSVQISKICKGIVTLWENWKYSVFEYAYPQVFEQFLYSPVYDFGCKTAVKISLTGTQGYADNVNNATFQLLYSDDNVNWTRVQMKSQAGDKVNVNREDLLKDGTLSSSSNVAGLRFQWTYNISAQVTYPLKHRYWKVLCNTQNNSGWDSFKLESVKI